MNRLLEVFVAAGFVAGCALPGDPQDGEHDTISDGKADGGYSAGEINGALRVANELSLAELDDDVGLSSLTAQNIVQQRPFANLAELDAVPYVGPVALATLVDYAHGGYIHWLPLLAPITAPGLSPGDGFGTRVALTDTYLAVSAPGADGGAGRVYMYERDASGWVATQSLVAGSTVVREFGRAIAIDGDTLVVSSDNYQAFVFEHGPSGWAKTQELYGGRNAVAIDGDYLAVDDYRWGSSRVRVWSRSGGVWEEYDDVPTAVIYDLALRDNLLVVAMKNSGTLVLDLVGAGLRPTQQIDFLPGATALALTSDRLALGGYGVAVYNRSGNHLVFASSVSGGPAHSSLALDETWVVAGAPAYSNRTTLQPSYEGAFYVYDRAGMLYERRTATSYRGYFGTSLAMEAGALVVGAPNDAGGSGVVYSN